MVCPCKGCEVRGAGCHSRCPAYSKWKKFIADIDKKRRLESGLDSFFSEPERWKDHCLRR